ncbi:MAG: DoxX family membrane protein [Bacteroidaceae bacterium]|nr:DoxX family membrane protein [Bacteroidaceae bacterium]
MKLKKNLWLWTGINLCRFLLAVTFVFSGAVKLIDPRGAQYKIEDYAALVGITDLQQYGISLVLAVGLALLEFYIGFNLFFGIRRRTTTRLALGLLLVMTPITFMLAVMNLHMDCGCFGDAVVLTNWQTFGKNLILLATAIVAVRYFRRFTRLISEGNQWMLSIYALVFALFFALYNLRYLPVMDFRPYHIGVDLPKAIVADWENGEIQYADFVLQNANGEDITLRWLEHPGYKFLLVAPYLEYADDGSMDRINAIYDYAQANGYLFLGVTSSLPEDIERWKDRTGAEYDFAQADGTALKTVIRSNPGILLLHDGVIYQKWSCNEFPQAEQLKEPLEDLQIGQLQQGHQMRHTVRLLLWFILPLLCCTLIDRIWVGRKLYKQHKRER